VKSQRAIRRYVASLAPRSSDYVPMRRTWRRDLLAGVTVGIVALPLALGFGVSSGLTPEAGLATAIVAGVIAAVFGGSHVQVSGPTGAMVVILVPIVATHGVGAVAVLSILAGLIVLAAGILKLGRAVAFIPWPVIEGFTVGIAVIIFAQQIPLLTAPDAHSAGHSTNAVVAAVQSLISADPVYMCWALGAAGVVAAVMLLAPRLHAALPGSLLGITVVTLLALALPAPLTVIGALPSSLPSPVLPDLGDLEVSALVLPAVTIAALAAIESLLSARVASSFADTGPFDPDRELVGQGLASIGSGLFGGMPATGAIARTAVNVRSGGRSRLSAITHALVLLGILAFAGGAVSAIPLAALAGVLMVTAARMVDISTVRAVLRSTRSDAVSFAITAVITVSLDLIVAVGIGMLCAVVFAVRNLSRSTRIEREPLPSPAHPHDDRIAVIRIDGPLIFTSSDRVFEEVMQTQQVTVVVLRMSHLEVVDATGARALGDIVRALERRGVTVLIKGVRPVHKDLFRSVGVLEALRHHNHLFTDIAGAVAHARSHTQREAESVT
jgi:SulP family sulfate permease